MRPTAAAHPPARDHGRDRSPSSRKASPSCRSTPRAVSLVRRRSVPPDRGRAPSSSAGGAAAATRASSRTSTTSGSSRGCAPGRRRPAGGSPCGRRTAWAPATRRTSSWCNPRRRDGEAAAGRPGWASPRTTAARTTCWPGPPRADQGQPRRRPPWSCSSSTHHVPNGPGGGVERTPARAGPPGFASRLRPAMGRLTSAPRVNRFSGRGRRRSDAPAFTHRAATPVEGTGPGAGASPVGRVEKTPRPWVRLRNRVA